MNSFFFGTGGWNAGSGAYSDMAADPIKRKTFVESVAEFLDKFDFDGVDLDWVRLHTVPKLYFSSNKSI